jgi:hypothetical protein
VERLLGGQHRLYVNPWERIEGLNGVAVCTVSKIKKKYLYTNLHFVFRAVYSFRLPVNYINYIKHDTYAFVRINVRTIVKKESVVLSIAFTLSYYPFEMAQFHARFLRVC